MQDVALIDNFVSNLRQACKEKGISQTSLSEISGIHFVTINRIFNGHISPTIETCEKLAKAAGVNPERIFLEPDALAVDRV
jgi:transcriptional regulator with XRE-family HTH domain